MTILGYYKLQQSTYDTFYLISSTLKTAQSRIFIFFIFFQIHVPGYMKLRFFFQRKVAQSWLKRLQAVTFSISITILGSCKLQQSTYNTFYLILSTLKTAQSSAKLDKKASNSKIFNFYDHIRIL
jgi:hypothetical protein